MRRTPVTNRIAAACLIVAGSLSAALAWSVHRHAELLAYGLKGTHTRVLALELCCVGFALVLLLSTRRAWRVKVKGSVLEL